jgi:hypothetical protein
MTGSASGGVLGPSYVWLRLVVVVGLAVDVVVHWHLASRFDTLTSPVAPHLSQGQLFRLEAAAALLGMVLVVVWPRRTTAALALLVAGGGATAVLLYALVDVGRLGPLPAMFDPSWYGEKTASLIFEATAAFAAGCWLVLLSRPREVDGR